MRRPMGLFALQEATRRAAEEYDPDDHYDPGDPEAGPPPPPNAKAAKPSTEVVYAANNQLGQALGKIGKTKESADAFDAAAKADPTKAASAYYNEAAILFNANDIDGAAAAADKAIAADPTKADAYFIKGQALVQKVTVDPKTNVVTAPPECVAAYQKYLELAPTGPHAQDVKDVLAGIGVKIDTSYRAAPAKKK